MRVFGYVLFFKLTLTNICLPELVLNFLDESKQNSTQEDLHQPKVVTRYRQTQSTEIQEPSD
jgi:hypothetical protein